MESSRKSPNCLEGVRSPDVKRAHSPNIMAHEPIVFGEKKEVKSDSSEDDSFVILESEDVNDNIKVEETKEDKEKKEKEKEKEKEMVVSQFAQYKFARSV
jgi:hypothetical protein